MASKGRTPAAEYSVLQLPVPTELRVPTDAAGTMSSPEGPSFPSGLLSGGASPSGDEGFFPFMLERRDSFLGGGPGPEEPEDLALQLQQKEKDLLLAAELGKMLLERNEELQRQLETLSTQHSEREEVSWRQGWAEGGQVAGARQVGRGRIGGQGRKARQEDTSGIVQGWTNSPWKHCLVVKNTGSEDKSRRKFRSLLGSVTLGKLLARSELWVRILSRIVQPQPTVTGHLLPAWL